MNARILIWTDKAPYPLTDILLKAGFQVWEALAVSEVLALCESKNIDIILITPEVDDAGCTELKQHYVMIKLHPKTTAADLIKTLWQMFPDKKPTIQ
jgi:hypothetical protein